jgi:hypothetical protein
MYKSKNKSADTQRVTATHTLHKTVRTVRDRYSLYANFEKGIQVPASGDRLFHKLVLKTLTADELVSAFFKIVIPGHGCPEQLMSDSGTQMVSSALKALCRSFNIIKTESSPYHVQANGKVEKFIGFLKKSLALITPERAPCTWDEMIDHCLFVYRISINRTLQDSIDAGRREELPIP